MPREYYLEETDPELALGSTISSGFIPYQKKRTLLRANLQVFGSTDLQMFLKCCTSLNMHAP